MAATLLLWKSKAILPDLNAELAADEEESILPLTPEELIAQLKEHERFLAAGDALHALPKLHEDFFQRPQPKPPIHKVWKEMNITTLAISYQESLVQSRKRKTVLRKETVSISEKIKEMALRLKMGELIDLNSLITDRAFRPETVVTFLASLELSRLKKLRVHQELNYGPILLELIDKITSLELQLATSFEKATQEESLPPQTEVLTALETPTLPRVHF
jgi:segregation and condensation protein A